MRQQRQVKEIDPRKLFGQIIRDARSRLNLERGEFAAAVGEIDHVSVDFIEHGSVRRGCRPIRRRLYLRMISVLRLVGKEKDEALRLLRQFCHHKLRRVKHDLPYSIKKRRQARFHGRKMRRK